MGKDNAFTITVGGIDRLLFWVEEESEGDLTIMFNHAPFAHLPDDLDKLAKSGGAESSVRTIRSYDIAEQHISVHPSPESPTQINAVKWTTVLKSGEKQTRLTERHYTSSMKRLSNYAPIFTCRSVKLDTDRYIHRDTNPTVTPLGTYDPAHFQLIYQILVSNLQSEKLFDGYRTNCVQKDFSLFRLTVLWTFLSLASEHRGQSIFLPTIKPEEMHLHDEEMRRLATIVAGGLPARQCISLFVKLAGMLKEIGIRRVAVEIAPNLAPNPTPDELAQLVSLMSKKGQFFKEGTVDRVRYKQHMRRFDMILALGERAGT